MQADNPAASASPAPLADDELKKRAMLAKQVAASFGEIVTLLLNIPSERKRPIEDLQWMVAPALMTGQFAVADAQSKENGIVVPVGAVLWAFVSEEVDRRLIATIDQPTRVEPKEWRSGPIPWVIMAIGDPKVVGGLLQQLAQNVFKSQPAKIRAMGQDGKPFVGRLEMSAGPQATS